MGVVGLVPEVGWGFLVFRENDWGMLQIYGNTVELDRTGGNEKLYFCSPIGEKTRYRGVVERFIAPVLKTGDPSRGPGVRIPPPLQTEELA